MQSIVSDVQKFATDINDPGDTRSRFNVVSTSKRRRVSVGNDRKIISK